MWLKNPLHKMYLFLAVMLTAVLLISLSPVYRNYIRQENTNTCYDAMYSFGLWYHLAAQAQTESGTPEGNIDYEEIARDVVRRHFGAELDENLSSGQICHAGGVWTIVIDPGTHRVLVQCTADGHIWYTDSVDDDMLETFRDMEY